ncbi:nucleotidyltransferase [Tenacibaculum maritimum]|nr:nucleotidyltransferase [Tenacibaculum maritimum]MDB0600271.1 nucleotidyltransferase [Tenacibaculum maritimum]MDB0610781.1 nucleotidyltransferase [Tenacibaculum maritimum]
MKDFYNNVELHREDIFARIAQKLELDPTRRNKMQETYQAVSNWLDKDDGFFKDLEIDIYAQGSVRIFTTVKPYNGEDFDLDIVLHINHLYSNYTPQQVYFELIRRLKENDKYRRIIKEKNRCARLDYAGDYHMDILPGCIVVFDKPNKINVPDKKLANWTSANPKDLADWFLNKSNLATSPILENYYKSSILERIELKAETEDLPNEHFYTRKPLQRATQLIKRYRDIYFDDKSEFKTSSIILTTLAGQLYNGENTIYETINNTLNKVVFQITEEKRLKIFNPINSDEDFTEKWDVKPELYTHFKNFIKDFYMKWQILKQDFSKSADTYDKLFGETIYKDTLINQTKFFAKLSDDNLIKSSGVLLGGSARTDKKGNINEINGAKNEPHRDFGHK